MFLDMIRKYFFIFQFFQRLDTTWVFNIQTEEWSQEPSMNQKRSRHSCFYDDQTNSVFVVGGYDYPNRLASTEQWNLDTNQWISTPALPEPLHYSAGVASKSSQFVGYVAGGWSYVGYTNKVLGLRRNDLVWEVMPQQLQTARREHSMVNVPADQIPGC